MNINIIKDILMNALNLPPHIAYDITYKFGGAEHPTAEGIKDYWDYMRNEQNAFTQIDVYSKRFINDDGKVRHRITHTERETDAPILHFPILFKWQNIHN